MTDKIRHRGPDDEGFLLLNTASQKHKHYHGADSVAPIKQRYPAFPDDFSANLGFGFRRLSILDLSEHGHQPMSLIEHGLHIVFNGEIYNYRELKTELEQSGCSFRSGSDTEVILWAYQIWGKDCVLRFNGMWAFAIWDEKRKQLFCSRDPFGIKPFYYALHNGDLYFASELKQLQLCPIPSELNLPMLWRSMKINAFLVYQDETFWQKYHALKAGCNFTFAQGELRVEQYYHWNPEEFESSKLSFDEAVEEYRRLFLDSVELQMRSDVEVGSCLSGGLDSSAIVCSAVKHTDKAFQTFSAYYDEDKALDERKWIQTITNQTHSSSHLISPRAEDTLRYFGEATAFNDLPVGAGFVSQYAVMQLAKANGIKVLLDGQGSDELTGGYYHSTYRLYADMIRSRNLRGLAKEVSKGSLRGSIPNALKITGKTLLSVLLPESKLYELEFRYYRFEPFNSAFRAQAKAESNGALLSEIEDIHSSRLSNFLYNLMRVTSIQTLLHYEDRMSMAHSVESRVPFLDQRLVRFAFSLPSSYKIQMPLQKYIHRIAMKDIVPREIFERKDKAIFSSPFYSCWMKGALKPMIEQILFSDAFRRRRIWDLPKIHAKWAEYLKGNNAHAEMLFSVIAMETWFETCISDGHTSK